jgi:N6-L-threonylcarbamoyladenine synthase
MALYLGLESSCDETAAAVVEDGRRVLSNVVLSQTEIHARFGGVVPEVAARQHLPAINHVVAEALSQAGVRGSDLTAIACTNGPGLVGTLLVGLSAAKALAWSWRKPLLIVDHLHAHVCANYLDTELEPPFVALLVSGGHSQILYCSDYGDMKILGQTRDDAAGEAYDKVARLLGLGYPGGPVIDRMAKLGNCDAFAFPEGVVPELDFSFSGLKTSVLRTVQKLEKPYPLEDICASFQRAVVNVLVKKTLMAQKMKGAKSIVLAGGVAANSELRAKFQKESSVPVFYPKIAYCTDNAAMVAGASHFIGRGAGLDCPVYSRVPVLKSFLKSLSAQNKSDVS